MISKVETDHKIYNTDTYKRNRDKIVMKLKKENLERLAKEGHKKILVFCPAFTSDCLETLYEIGMEYAEEFKSFGGKSLDLVPGLNDDPLFVEAISSIVESYCSYTQHVSKV